MGQGLRKPVKSIVVKRHPGKLFRVGIAEMNGWRQSMEDSHVIFDQDTWGFFGVYDGHGGSQCSTFVAKRFHEELAKGAPKDDAALRSLVLQLDREFLETEQPSGSTGTFAVVRPEGSEGRFTLNIGNVGDSRVLLGRADGTMVEGTGTDGGLTTDHKPDHPSERERIERTGGTVEFVQGVARVNGDLAVSRAFGDAPHKKTGPSLEEQPVSAAPEFTSSSCDSTDFLMLVCDGISEGNFPNREVVKLAAEELRKGGDRPDPGAAATAVCRMALEKGSMDNLSCMIVLFNKDGEMPGKELELLPGPFQTETPFREAYAAMALHAGLSLAQAVEMRYDLVRESLAAAGTNAGTEETAELSAYGDGPPEALARGSAERTRWFNTWIEENSGDSDGNPFGMNDDLLLQLAMANRDRFAPAEPPERPLRRVKVGSVDEVRAAIAATSCPTMQWGPSIEQACSTQGEVWSEDSGDGTAKVIFEENGPKVQLPLSALTTVMVEVCSLEQLRPAVEKNRALKWDKRLADTCGTHGLLVQEDSSDGTSNVHFPVLDFSCWLPSDCLTEVSAVQKKVCSEEQLRPAVEAHSALKWNDRLADTCGKYGVLLKEDSSDGLSHLTVCLPSSPLTVWLPSACLAPGGGVPPEASVEDAVESTDGASAVESSKGAIDSSEGSPAKRQRTSV